MKLSTVKEEMEPRYYADSEKHSLDGDGKDAEENISYDDDANCAADPGCAEVSDSSDSSDDEEIQINLARKYELRWVKARMINTDSHPASLKKRTP